MIPRYTRKEMGQVWSDENRYQRWLDVELAAAETLAEAGQVPEKAAAILRERAKVNVARINELEAKVKHDVIAFTMAVGESDWRPGCRAMAALRNDLERRRGHGAGFAGARRIALDRARPGAVWRSAGPAGA